MPVYLCQAGADKKDPWRYGIHVYEKPFSMEDFSSPVHDDLALAVASDEPEILNKGLAGRAIRRVRHAEICIVDDVCVAYQRYWLRLRWPGSKGGFAGYIAMQRVDAGAEHPTDILMAGKMILSENLRKPEEDKAAAHEETDADDAARDESSMPPSEPFDESSIKNKRNALTFQTSGTLKLLAVYDDGVDPSITLPPSPTEPVFCRICREGLHDDADNEQPAPQVEDGGEDSGRESSDDPAETARRTAEQGQQTLSDEPVATDPPAEDSALGPVLPHPKFAMNTHAQENPLLAPCECAGSMAFVHYLCVEQWRCRSRHPEARNGLHCETCGTVYALPPPSARPAHVNAVDQEDWLDAMPPHVLQALRQPHLLWQIGASIVRRKWLRPIAPIVASPIVALYCRARRLLKKRGVARRRWACSLCRRRARWKCVRCLRSYYCSRQCQNVSWHIVHKHVCFKPSRFWQSCVFYGALIYFLLPGARRDPFIYDQCLILIPALFYLTAVIGGGLTTCCKHFLGTDLRGRPMELAVVLGTMWLFWLQWGIISGFFGMPQECRGYFGTYVVDESSVVAKAGVSILGVARMYFTTLDQLPLVSDFTASWLCEPSRYLEASFSGTTGRTTVAGWLNGCFEHLSDANPSFFVGIEGEKCAADMMTMGGTCILAFLSLLTTLHLKNRERHRRRRGGGRPRVPHLHED